MEWNRYTLQELWRDHKWAILLPVLAFIFAVCVISYGFFRAVFIFVCVGLGLYGGLLLDRRQRRKGKSEDFYDHDR